MARLAQWAALALAAAAASAAQPAAGPGPLMALLHGHGRGAPAVDLRLDADAAWVAELGAAAGRRLAAAATISGGGHVFVLGVAGSPEAVAAEAAAAAAGGGAPVDLVPAVGAMVLAMQAKFDVQERGDLGTLWNALFWCACLAGAALVLHVALRALVVWRGARMPGFLEYPAVELLLLSALVPIVAAAAAPFYAGTTAGQVAAAVVFGALLPAVYLAFVFYLVVRHVALAEPASRRAVFLLRAPAAAGGAAAAGDGASSAEGSTGSSGGGARASLSESLISGKQSDAPGAGAAAAPAARPTRGARALALLDRFLFIPVFGWRPAEAGEWVDADPASRFTARYGPLFAEVKGPRAELAEDSGAAAAAEGGRGAGRPALRPAPPASRAARARETAQLLGVAVNELKVILFANVLAGASAGADPAAPLALLLAVTAASWAYLRFAAPPATRVDLAVEVLETVCDAGTLAAGVALAFTPPTDFAQIGDLGWAMLAFQLGGLACAIAPRLAHMLVRAAALAYGLTRRRRPKLERVVAAAMARDPACLARKFGGRWLRAALRRELGGRALAPAPSVLPFRMATLARAASAVPLRLQSMQRVLSRRAPELPSHEPLI